MTRYEMEMDGAREQIELEDAAGRARLMRDASRNFAERARREQVRTLKAIVIPTAEEAPADSLYHVDGCYYANLADADLQRKWKAERIARQERRRARAMQEAMQSVAVRRIA